MTDPAAGTLPLGASLPEHETAVTSGQDVTSGRTSEKKTQSPEQLAAQAEQEAVTKAQIAGTEEVKTQKKAENAIAADTATAGAGLATKQEENLTNALLESQKRIDAEGARIRSKQAEYDAAPPVSYFRKGDTWRNATKAAAMALGGIGDAIQKAAMVRIGHAPPTLDTPGEIITRDLESQKERINELKDSVVMARTGLKDATEARQQMIADVELKGAAAAKRLEALARARLAAQGMSAPDIEQHQTILALQKAQADAKVKAIEPLYATVTNRIETAKKGTTVTTARTGKPDAKAAEAAAQAPALAEAYKQMAGYNPGLLEGVTPNALKDTEGQQFGAAEARLKAAIMGELVSKRGLTSEGAEKMYNDMYGIRPTDKPETQLWKRQNLRRDLDAMTGGAVGRELGGQPAAAPAPAQGGTVSPVAPSVKPAIPPPSKTNPDRDRAIRFLKSNRGRPGAAAVMQKFGITEADLGKVG
jgi:hypothetical protein